MARPGLLLYFDILPALDKLPHEAVGELLLKALHYAQDGVEPTFEGSALTFAWAFLRPVIDRDGAAYDEKRQRGDWLTYCRQCKRDGIDALDFDTWRERIDNGTLQPVDVALPTTTHNQPNSNTPPSSAQRQLQPIGDSAAQLPSALNFTPPTLGEVAAYVKERGSAVDPQGFIDFYAARGWMIGSALMMDWKAACRNAESWERWSKPTAPNRGHAKGQQGFQPSLQKIQENNDWLDAFLAEQAEKEGKNG